MTRARSLDFHRYGMRCVALRLAYFGWAHDGFASQQSSANTVEGHLICALLRARLIPHSPFEDHHESEDSAVHGHRYEHDTSNQGRKRDQHVAVDPWHVNYSRCGRTDAGVSALDQVVVLNVRSGIPEQAQHPHIHYAPFHRQDSSTDACSPQLDKASPPAAPPPLKPLASHWAVMDMETELPYVDILNRLLPDTIRIVGWQPAPPGFSARFHCRSRTYKYFFPRHAAPLGFAMSAHHRFQAVSGFALPAQDGNGLHIDKMRAACQLLLGTHDFRWFCKMDHSKPDRSTDRTLLHCQIDPYPAGQSDGSWYALTVTGHAFLWRQVRCLMGFLFHVGWGNYQPDQVPAFLRPTATDVGRPQYTIASPIPLVLWHCDYEHGVGPDWLVPVHPNTLALSERRVGELELEQETKTWILKQFLSQTQSRVVIQPPVGPTASNISEAYQTAWDREMGHRPADQPIRWQDARDFFLKYGLPKPGGARKCKRLLGEVPEPDE